MIEPLTLAKYIINRSIDIRGSITLLTLFKFMYFVHRDYYMEEDENLLPEESFRLYKFGPGVPSIYNRYELVATYMCKEEEPMLNHRMKNKIDSILSKYINLEPWVLVGMINKSKYVFDIEVTSNKSQPIPESRIILDGKIRYRIA